MAGNFFDQFDETPAKPAGNYFDQFDVVDQGGPRSLMGATLSKIDPGGDQRRTQSRMTTDTAFADQIDPEGADNRRLNRGRSSLDMKARMSAPFGNVYTALDAIGKTDQGFLGGAGRQGAKMIRGATGSPLEGAAFSFDDEIVGLLGGEKAKQQRRDEQFASRTDTPVTNFAGNLAGGVISPVNKPLMALTGVKTAATTAKGLGQLAREGARVGAAGGALYGAGAADGGDRVRGAVEGGIYGAVGGAALGAGAGAIGNKFSTGQFLPGKGGTIFDTIAQSAGIPNSARDGLRKVLSGSGYSADDIDRGVVNAVNRLQRATEQGDRVPLFATALQDEFPAAQQNIQDVFQQLMTAPPTQGRSGRILTQALDDQYGSQGTYLEGVAQQKLGTRTVAEEQGRIAAERGAIGETRDRAIKFAATDARGRGIQNRMRDWWGELSNDPEVAGNMRAAARELGYPRTAALSEVEAALADNPALLLQKFGEISGAQIRSPRGASPVLERARVESEALFDDLSRYGREADNVSFAKRAEGETGPYKQQQARFRQNYSQEEAITDARGRFSQVRDPVKADEFVGWYNSLPEGEQTLVKTVIRQDIEKMLRGGNIDQDGAYLTNLKKVGVNDVLQRLFGKEGEDITRAISTLVDEQKGLTSLDPRKGLQERVVRGGAADRARNLYTTNPIARLGDKIPAASQLGDLALMSQGQLPYITIARQAMKAFRPNARTREGIAQILAMREAPALPPPTGTLSRMPGPAAAGGASQAGGSPPSGRTALPAPAQIRTSQQAPWTPVQVPQETPVIVPRVQTGAQRAADQARQRAVDAQQRAANAEARKADAETIRRTLVEAKQAEAEAKIAEIQARNAAKVTQAQLEAVAKAAREKVRAAKKAGKQEGGLSKREIEAREAKARGDQELEAALDREQRLNQAARDEAAGVRDTAGASRIRAGTDRRVDRYTEQQRYAQASKNAKVGIDPVETFDQTGVVALSIDGKPFMPANAAQDLGIETADDLIRVLQRVEDDVLGKNANRPDKWSPMTAAMERAFGLEKLKAEILKGEVSGWRTPQERATQKGFQTGAKIAAGAAGLTGTAIAVSEGYKAVDAQAQKRRAQRIMESPELTKIVQRSLKAVRQYDGRADGKFDGDVMTGVAQFQGTYGLGKSSAPGTLDTATLKKLEEMLVFEGKTKLADEIRDIRRNKLKGKEI